MQIRAQSPISPIQRVCSARKDLYSSPNLFQRDNRPSAATIQQKFTVRVNPLFRHKKESQDQLMRDISYREVLTPDSHSEHMRHENQTLQNKVQELSKEIFQLQQKLNQQQAETKQTEDLKVFKKIYQCSQQEVQDLKYEIEHYKYEITQLKNDLTKFVNQNKQQPLDLTNLEIQVRVRDEIIEDKNKEITRLKRQGKDPNQDNEQIQQKYDSVKEVNNQLSIEIQSLQSQIKSLSESAFTKEEQQKKIVQQNVKLHLLIKDYEKSTSSHAQEKENLISQNKALTNQLSDVEQTISQQNIQIDDLRSQIKEYQEMRDLYNRERADLKDQLKSTQTQIQRQQDHKNKQSEVKLIDACDKLKVAQENIRLLTVQNEALQSQLQSALEASDYQKQRNANLQSKVQNLEKTLSTINDDIISKAETIQRLENLTVQSQKQIVTLNSQNNDLTSEAKVFISQIDNLRKQIDQFRQEYAQAQGKAREEEQMIQKLTREKTELLNIDDQNRRIISDLNDKLQMLEIEIQEKEQFHRTELDSWKEKFIQLNREYHKHQENYMMLTAEYDAFKQQRKKNDASMNKDPLKRVLAEQN